MGLRHATCRPPPTQCAQGSPDMPEVQSLQSLTQPATAPTCDSLSVSTSSGTPHRSLALPLPLGTASRTGNRGPTSWRIRRPGMLPHTVTSPGRSARHRSRPASPVPVPASTSEPGPVSTSNVRQRCSKWRPRRTASGFGNGVSQGLAGGRGMGAATRLWVSSRPCRGRRSAAARFG